MLAQLVTLASKKSEQVMDATFVSSVVITGLVVVFVVLILLVLFVSAFGLFFKKNSKPSNQADAEKKKIILPQPKIEKGINNEIIAVIAATIAAMSSSSADGKSYTIKSIKQVKPKRSPWAFAGLQDNTRPF